MIVSAVAAVVFQLAQAFLPGFSQISDAGDRHRIRRRAARSRRASPSSSIASTTSTWSSVARSYTARSRSSSARCTWGSRWVSAPSSAAVASRIWRCRLSRPRSLLSAFSRSASACSASRTVSSTASAPHRTRSSRSSPNALPGRTRSMTSCRAWPACSPKEPVRSAPTCGCATAQIWREAAVWPAHGSARPSRYPAVNGTLPDIPGTSRLVEVRHQGTLLGALGVTKRSGEALTPVEEKLLVDLAGQAGLVLRNVGLTTDLQARLDDLRASRQRLVTAQDQERRRLERNLHDGAQQHLVAIKVKLGLAEILLGRDPVRAQQTLDQLKSDADEALETLRDLARGIYPPLLADKGLRVALESQARKATVAGIRRSRRDRSLSAGHRGGGVLLCAGGAPEYSKVRAGIARRRQRPSGGREHRVRRRRRRQRFRRGVDETWRRLDEYGRSSRCTRRRAADHLIAWGGDDDHRISGCHDARGRRGGPAIFRWREINHAFT